MRQGLFGEFLVPRLLSGGRNSISIVWARSTPFSRCSRSLSKPNLCCSAHCFHS